MEPDTPISEDDTRRHIDLAEYYKSIIDAGPETEEGKRLYRDLYISDSVTDALQKIEVAGDIAKYAAGDYKRNHPGEEIITEGVRFGISTTQLDSVDGRAPIRWNQLTVEATHPGTGERVMWSRRFSDSSELLELAGLSKGTPRAHEVQTKLSSLVNRQPILVQKTAGATPNTQ